MPFCGYMWHCNLWLLTRSMLFETTPFLSWLHLAHVVHTFHHNTISKTRVFRIPGCRACSVVWSTIPRIYLLNGTHLMFRSKFSPHHILSNFNLFSFSCKQNLNYPIGLTSWTKKDRLGKKSKHNVSTKAPKLFEQNVNEGIAISYTKQNFSSGHHILL